MDSRNTFMNKSNSLINTHYGSLHFDKSLFVSVRNMDRLPKPADGTGLWASRKNDIDGWEAWCRRNDYKADEHDMHFRFTIPDAHILTISEQPDLNPGNVVEIP